MMQFSPNTLVDFVVVGVGAAGGVMAKELSTAGFTVVALEQGPYKKAADFHHDEYAHNFQCRAGARGSSPPNPEGRH